MAIHFNGITKCDNQFVYRMHLLLSDGSIDDLVVLPTKGIKNVSVVMLSYY